MTDEVSNNLELQYGLKTACRQFHNRKIWHKNPQCACMYKLNQPLNMDDNSLSGFLLIFFRLNQEP